MPIFTSDIRMVRSFAERLKSACDIMLNGSPRSQALVKEGISPSIFTNLIRSLKKSKDEAKITQKDIDDLIIPSWEDRLAYDISGEDTVFLPADFEDTLDEIMSKFLSVNEAQVIKLLYPLGKSMAEAREIMDVSEPTIRQWKTKALKKLRERKEGLYVGVKRMRKINEIKEETEKYNKTLEWMRQALRALEKIGEEQSIPIADEPISEEAIGYYRRNGLDTLADVCNYSLQELFTDITDEKCLAVVREDDSFSLDSPLDESIGLDKRVAEAFKEAGIRTVREFLALSTDEAFSIKGVGDKTVVEIYRKVILG